jgi:hypothetical protein
MSGYSYFLWGKFRGWWGRFHGHHGSAFALHWSVDADVFGGIDRGVGEFSQSSASGLLSDEQRLVHDGRRQQRFGFGFVDVISV